MKMMTLMPMLAVRPNYALTARLEQSATENLTGIGVGNVTASFTFLFLVVFVVRNPVINYLSAESTLPTPPAFLLLPVSLGKKKFAPLAS